MLRKVNVPIIEPKRNGSLPKMAWRINAHRKRLRATQREFRDIHAGKRHVPLSNGPYQRQEQIDSRPDRK